MVTPESLLADNTQSNATRLFNDTASQGDQTTDPGLARLYWVCLGVGLAAILCCSIVVQVLCLMRQRRRRRKYEISKHIDGMETRSVSSCGHSWEAWTISSDELSRDLEMRLSGGVDMDEVSRDLQISYPDGLEEEVRELMGQDLLLVLGPKPCPGRIVLARTPHADDVINGGYVIASHDWPTKESKDVCTQTEPMLVLSLL